LDEKQQQFCEKEEGRKAEEDTRWRAIEENDNKFMKKNGGRRGHKTESNEREEATAP
jgi:hypothetical protein